MKVTMVSDTQYIIETHAGVFTVTEFTNKLGEKSAAVNVEKDTDARFVRGGKLTLMCHQLISRMQSI